MSLALFKKVGRPLVPLEHEQLFRNFFFDFRQLVHWKQSFSKMEVETNFDKWCSFVETVEETAVEVKDKLRRTYWLNSELNEGYISVISFSKEHAISNH